MLMTSPLPEASSPAMTSSTGNGAGCSAICNWINASRSAGTRSSYSRFGIRCWSAGFAMRKTSDQAADGVEPAYFRLGNSLGGGGVAAHARGTNDCFLCRAHTCAVDAAAGEFFLGSELSVDQSDRVSA